jgi:hypothetical protein
MEKDTEELGEIGQNLSRAKLNHEFLMPPKKSRFHRNFLNRAALFDGSR